ncbi:MAG: DUF2284 domain-containing protein [Clostridiaceae bacterium]|nr:DUF2284 domain-containing protein [Clostridiaceae bacterium]
MIEDRARYVDSALRLGAADAVEFDLADIVFDPRTWLKCMFGCADWGKGPTCPSRPGSPTPWQYRDMLSRYQWGVIVHAPDKKTSQRVSLAIEREAFLDGYHFAFSLSDCGLCEPCAGCATGEPCRFPKSARPAFHSVGIDVFSTVRAFGLPIRTLTSPEDPQNWYSAVFIE